MAVSVERVGRTPAIYQGDHNTYIVFFFFLSFGIIQGPTNGFLQIIGIFGVMIMNYPDSTVFWKVLIREIYHSIIYFKILYKVSQKSTTSPKTFEF